MAVSGSRADTPDEGPRNFGGFGQRLNSTAHHPKSSVLSFSQLVSRRHKVAQARTGRIKLAGKIPHRTAAHRFHPGIPHRYGEVTHGTQAPLSRNPRHGERKPAGFLPHGN